MTRVKLGFTIISLDPSEHTGLQVDFQAGPEQDGARTGMEIVVAPVAVPSDQPFNGWTVADGLAKLGDLLGISEISDIAKLQPPAPWDKLFNAVQLSPSLRLQPVGRDPSVSLNLQLFETGKAHDSGVTIGGQIAPGISISPEITVFDLVAGYSKSKGMDLKARVTFLPSNSSTQLRLGDAPPGKPQLVSYPFPVPDQNASASFKLNFLGLGQRFAPTIDLNAPDPLKSAFDALKATFTSDDPETILNSLVKNYYKPEVGWFFALDLYVRGFTVRAVLADPVLYGLEITCDTVPFKGLLAEILYQKIGADLGVFYGKIVLPDNIRQIEVGAGSATIPSFQIWIYTNGDFKIAIGWPLGPDSFSLQVLIFMGEAGMYFGKLRSGDNPTGRTTPQVTYNPILVFGLALKIGIGRSISKGPISAEASLTVQGVFQGLLAWKAAGASGETGIAQEPDYYWFSASVTLAGVVQGSVDLVIVSATVSISVWMNVATAFETNCGTVISASAGVDVSASLKIVFITIHIHFSATLDLSVTLIDGSPVAAMDGPSDPELRAFIPNPQIRLRSFRPLRRAALAAEASQTINLSFILQPAVPYDATGAGQIGAVASLLIASPDPATLQPGTDFERLSDLLTPWLMSNWGGPGQNWAAVVSALGQGSEAAPGNFETALSQLLAGISFTITGIDLTAPAPATTAATATATIFPMLNSLTLTVGAKSWNFGSDPLTYSGYPAALAEYFATLSALTPQTPSLRADGPSGAPDGPSLAHLLYVNWFLAMARQIASTLADNPHSTATDLPDTATLATIAGMLSRMALHGTRLPDPSVVHQPGDPISESIIQPLYSLEHQQFTAAAETAVQASLAISGNSPLNISFATGSSATAILPGGTAPPAPSPGWHLGTDSAPGIAVSPLPALTPGPLNFAVTARTTGQPSNLFPGATAAGGVQFLTLPASAVPLIAAGGLTGELRLQTDLASPLTPCAPGLLIPLGLRRVPLLPTTNVVTGGGTASATPVWCKDVYELIGTDDDSRALLEQALDDTNFAVHSVTPLTFQNNTLTAAALDAAKQPVLLFKSNLSTTSQPNMLATPLLLLRRLTANEDLGPVAANLTDTKNFLRLVWEASVVHSSGFYLRYADASGNGLPDELFSKDVARFWLWLDLGAAPASGPTSLPPYANQLVITNTGTDAKATQYLTLRNADTPLLGWRPAMPPGCAGAQLVWNTPPETDATPYSAASVAALYHMIELQIAGGGKYNETLWSTAISPTAQTKDGSSNILSATYQQVIPAWNFLAAQTTNPYAAIGTDLPLNFRLSDVYGNVLTTASGQFAATLPVVYNDPLLPPSAWPGCHAAYDLTKGSQNQPVLTVTIVFDPAGLQAHAGRLRSRAAAHGARLASQSVDAARASWTLIAQQVHDTNFQAAVSTTLYGDPASGDIWPIVGDPASTLAQLRAMVHQLNSVVQSPDPVKTTVKLSLPLDLSRIASRGSDIFPLGVRLSFSRDNTVPDLVAKLPAIAAAICLLQPNLPPPADAPVGTTPVPPLTLWAQQVEALLAKFDGQNGQVKLAQRPLSATADTSADPGLWAVRLSASAGISVMRQPAASTPAFFTMQPFSTVLQYGSAPVTVWDASLSPTTLNTSAASVDPDLLAQNFFASFDRLTAPDLAASIARIGGATAPNAFAKLMDNKATIAKLLSQRLIPIFTQQPAGDLAEAATQFEQALLAQLSNAYNVTAIAQVPLSVAVAASEESGAAMPPRLYGGLNNTGTPGTAPFTLTSPKLALDGISSPWLTFLATVKQPELESTLTFNLHWTISYIEHDFETSEKRYGYLPSGWLKFIIPDIAGPLRVELGKVDLPVPLRRYPAAPVLISQSANATDTPKVALQDSPIEDLIRAKMKWPFAVSIGKADQAAQDDLWVTSTFNQPIDWQPTATPDSGPLTALTTALLQFQAGFASIAPLLPLLEGNDPLAPKLIDVLVGLVGTVTNALTAPKLLLAVPEIEQLIWVLRYAQMEQNILTVFARVNNPAKAATPLLFPSINGLAPSGTPSPTPTASAPDNHPGWQQLTYQFPGQIPAVLDMSIDGLDLLNNQTVVASTRITRNADVGAQIVDSRLVYQTPEISFSNVLVPYVEVTDTLGPVSGDSLQDMLVQILTPFAQAGGVVGQERILRIGAAYNYPLVTPAGGGEPLIATIPTIMDAGAPIGPDPTPVAQRFTNALQQWGENLPLPRTGASFSYALSLFINVSTSGVTRAIPLLTIDRIDLTLPSGWPQSG